MSFRFPLGFFFLFSPISWAEPQAHSEKIPPILIQEKTKNLKASGSRRFQSNRWTGASSPSEVLRMIPGLNLKGSGGPGQPMQLSIRGARSGHSLVLIDGVPVQDPSLIEGGFDLSRLGVENIESIEILPGPQTVKYGLDALAGVVLIQTRKKKQSLNLTSGSFETLKLKGDLSLENNSAIRVNSSAQLNTTKGYSAARSTKESEEPDGHRQFDSTHTLEMKPQDRWSQLFRLRLAQSEADLDRSGGTLGDDPNFHSTQKAWVFFSRSQFDLNPASSLQIEASSDQSLRTYRNEADSTNSTDSRDQYWSVSQKLQALLTHRFAQNFQWNFGIHSRILKMSSESELNGMSSRVEKKKQDSLGGSTQLSFFGEKLESSLGVRLDQISPEESVGSAHTLWSYPLTERLTATLQASLGARPPSLFQLHSPFGNPQLRSERARLVDLSFDFKSSERLQLSSTLFSTWYENLIVFSTQTQKYRNQEKMVSQGIEFGLNFSISPILQSHWDFTYLDARDENDLKQLRTSSFELKQATQVQLSKVKTLFQVTYASEKKDLDPENFNRIQLPASTRFGVQVVYPWSQNFEIKLEGQNLFSTEGEPIAGYNPQPPSYFVEASYFW